MYNNNIMYIRGNPKNNKNYIPLCGLFIGMLPQI